MSSTTSSSSLGSNTAYMRGQSWGSSAAKSNSNNSHCSNSTVSMDEAYRRLGLRLSQRVLGDVAELPPPHAAVSLSGHSTSAFSPARDATVRTPAELYNRTAKVAKMRYTDHGSHQKLVQDSVLKRVTYRAKDTFQALTMQEQEQKQQQLLKSGKKRISPTMGVSPQRHALSALELDEPIQTITSLSSPAATIETSISQPKQQQPSSSSSSSSKGLLQSVLEQGAVSSIKSLSSSSASSSFAKGKCLTQPAEAVANEGLDNSEGNLIVYEQDRITVPPRLVQALVSPGRHDFRVVGLLGQGTFAQVFQCRCLQTGQDVAVKIVKNKPAYTRQAAVEIDVFRALSADTNGGGGSSSTTEDKDTMVRLQCYFLYQSHLCLVFELLGLNLYEVLKKRQFRGLPLPIVRTLIQQAMEGVKDLSQKSIVHCDLKPENILLCNDDDVDSVVNAGDGRRLTALETTKKPDDDKNLTYSGGTPSTEDTGRTASETSSQTGSGGQKIKLIDFGSACFEGHPAHTYIQSRFYRSPEVLIGLPYDSAIDMWSLGCVAAELFLGLPILPGVHEHDQLGRICEMISTLPDWMLDQGSKSTKYFVKQFSRATDSRPGGGIPLPPRTPSPAGTSGSSPPPARMSWRIKTLPEYIQSLSANELRKKGGLEKLQKQPANRYFKRSKLADIVMLHGHCTSNEDREQVGLFVHFLLGILNPDPWKRWTAYQASMHPFITGSVSHRRRQGTGSASNGVRADGTEKAPSREFDIYWVPPWDPSICRRRLLNVQKTREKQQALRRNFSGNQSRSQGAGGGQDGDLVEASPDRYNVPRRSEPASPALGTSRVTAMTDAMSLSRHSNHHSLSNSQISRTSPPPVIDASGPLPGRLPQNMQPGVAQHMRAGSLGSSMGAVHRSDRGRMEMMQNVPHSSYVAATSLTDYHHPGMVDNRIASMMVSAHGMNGGYDVPAQQPIHYFPGPQSYSGVSYEGMHQMPMEGDFGYALQRPGVVPGMSGELSSSMSQQMPAGMAYSPHQMPSPGGRPGSYTHSSSVAHNSSRGRRRHSYNMSGISASPRNQPQSSYMHNGYLPSPTSIQEDGTDYLGVPMDPTMGPSSFPTSSLGSSGTSLLAQQLEQRSNNQMPHNSMHDVRLASDGNNPEMHRHGNPPALLPNYVGPGPGGFEVYAHSSGVQMNAHPGGGYYTTYVTANGVTMMSAPTTMDLRNGHGMPPIPAHLPSNGSYGSYPDQSGIPMYIPYGAAPNSLPQGAYSPYHQQMFDDMERSQHNPMMNVPRQAPRYHGMSM